MQYIFINPPNYLPSFAPIPGVPVLRGILESKNISTEYIDLNFDFFKTLLNSDYLNKYIDLINKILNNEIPNIEKFGFDIEENFLKKSLKEIFYFKKYSSLSKKIFFSKDLFYNPYILQKVLNTNVFGNCGNITDITFVKNLIPDVIDYRSHCENPDFTLDIELLNEYLNSEIFKLKNYYEKVIEKIIKKNPICIGITIGIPYQFIPAMLFAYMLKQKASIHINIGGSFFDHLYKNIVNLKDIFPLFCDSVSINDNTKTVYQLVEYIEGKRKISEVENIIYNENGELKINNSNEKCELSKLPFQVFNSSENYILPELVLPVQASTGCYWGKCIFCRCNGEKYNIKPVQNFVDEIEYLSKKYKTKFFYFWDNALPPQYLDKMSDLLKERKLNIRYSMLARFEKEYDLKLLKKLQKSGCRFIYWGMDSASDRVLKYIDKGIDIQTAKKVLKQAKSAKIGNFVYIIFGHPTETYDELLESYDFCKKMKKYVIKYNISPECVFLDGSIITKNRDYYVNKILTTNRERNILYSKLQKEINNIFNNRLQDFICEKSAVYLLYMEKYGYYKLPLVLNFYNFIYKHEKFAKIFFRFISEIKGIYSKLFNKKNMK